MCFHPPVFICIFNLHTQKSVEMPDCKVEILLKNVGSWQQRVNLTNKLCCTWSIWLICHSSFRSTEETRKQWQLCVNQWGFFKLIHETKIDAICITFYTLFFVIWGLNDALLIMASCCTQLLVSKVDWRAQNNFIGHIFFIFCNLSTHLCVSSPLSVTTHALVAVCHCVCWQS